MSIPTLNEIDPELVSTCVHELAHAVVARELGLTPDLVRVNPWFGGGYCTTKEPIDTYQKLHDMGVCLVAGFEGENHWRLLNGFSAASTWASGADRAQFRSARLEIQRDSEDVTLVEQKACAQANGILVLHWDEIEELVPELAHKGTLHGIGEA